MTFYQLFGGSEFFGKVDIYTTPWKNDFYVLVDGVGYMWIHKDDIWALIIPSSIQDLCTDCWDECRCLDHPWFNLKKRPKPNNYFHPYR